MVGESVETPTVGVVRETFPGERRVALVNCRADRPDRSRQLGEACVAWGEADHYVLIGSGTYIFAKEAIRMGLDPGRITYAEDRRIEEIFEVIIDLAGNSALIIGIANIGGQGLELARFFKNRSVPGLKEVVA